MSSRKNYHNQGIILLDSVYPSNLAVEINYSTLISPGPEIINYSSEEVKWWVKSKGKTVVKPSTNA